MTHRHICCRGDSLHVFGYGLKDCFPLQSYEETDCDHTSKESLWLAHAVRMKVETGRRLCRRDILI